MKILHLTPHLGGGVGKAHAAVQTATEAGIKRVYCLLEEPRDRRFSDLIVDAGAEVVISPSHEDLDRRIAAADIVQIEWWNHPRLYQLLARPLPPMRSLFWAHVSGLSAPFIPAGLPPLAGRFLFTSPCSLASPAIDALSLEVKRRLGVAGSGFGFDASPEAPPLSERKGMAYLGTVDFVKMHPGFFRIVDALENDTEVEIWGGFDPDGEPVRAARAMRHPERVAFRGHAADPRAVLERVAVFFYPLREDHYGTAENALVEAMSVGAVPLVLANPAERAIVEHGRTGLVAPDVESAAGLLEQLLTDDALRHRLARAAMTEAAERFRPSRTAAILATAYEGLLREEKRVVDFRAALGADPRAWFLSTQFRDARLPAGVRFGGGAAAAKGSIDHFLAAFPHDEGLLSLL